MGTGAEKGLVTVLFRSVAEQGKGECPRRDPAKETDRFPSTSAPAGTYGPLKTPATSCWNKRPPLRSVRAYRLA
jgi:hypothetical protein